MASSLPNQPPNNTLSLQKHLPWRKCADMKYLERHLGEWFDFVSVFVMQNCWQQMGAMMINWSLHNKLPSNLFSRQRKEQQWWCSSHQWKWDPHRVDRHTVHISISIPKAKNTKSDINWPYFWEKSEEMRQKKTCNAQVEILLLGSILKVIFGNKLFCALEFAVLGRLAAHQSCANGWYGPKSS